MATPVCTIDATGIHVPVFADCLTYYQSGLQSIYGSDIVLSADTQDGQLTGILALALSDTNAMCEAAYNAYSPATAQGVGLSSVVKTNGIARAISTTSSVDLVIIGQAGATLTNAKASDGTNIWLLPTSLTIPTTGQIMVTATAATAGAITAAANTITQIAYSSSSNTLGWQSVYNPTAASPGAPLETDAALRIRQSKSTALPSQSILDGIVGAVLAIPGVTSATPYENDTDTIDANGVPGHCVSMVVIGGDDTEVATVISTKKGICGTYGTTAVIVQDEYGITRTIRFYRPRVVPITAKITLTALQGFTFSTQAGIVNALVAYVNGLGSGVQTVGLFRCSGVLYSAPQQSTFNIEAVQIARDGAPTTASDVSIAFYEQPIMTASDVQIAIASS